MDFKFYEKFGFIFGHSLEDNLYSFYHSKDLGIKLNEPVPYEVERGYEPPQFSVNDIVEKLASTNTLEKIESLYISFISSSKGIDKFANLRQLKS